jgi:NAD(P)-dependent dehydrogenase (short-subunit alcohol dehydrogenase family)
MNLKNAVALVTGGGSGLGEATVREFAAGGAKVAILDLPSSPGAKVAESLGANALFVEADVASADQVTDAIAKIVAKFSSIQIAVNCAGIGRAMRTVTKDGPHSLDLFSKVIAVNLIGTFNVTRLAAAQMAKNQPGTDGRARRHYQYCVGRRVRRTNRAGRVLGVERRRGFDDAADRARPRVARRPHLHDRTGNFRDPDAGGSARS